MIRRETWRSGSANRAGAQLSWITNVTGTSSLEHPHISVIADNTGDSWNPETVSRGINSEPTQRRRYLANHHPLLPRAADNLVGLPGGCGASRATPLSLAAEGAYVDTAGPPGMFGGLKCAWLGCHPDDVLLPLATGTKAGRPGSPLSW